VTLRRFYAEVRTKQGEYYRKTSLTAIRYGLNRHVNEARRLQGMQPVDIVKDTELTEANDMFKAVCKVLKENDKANIRHHGCIEAGDLKQMWTYFSSGLKENQPNPRVLQQFVFVNIVAHFGRRGRENLRDLRRTDFAVTTKLLMKGQKTTRMTLINVRPECIKKQVFIISWYSCLL
jgi:hypothetical protein